MNGRDENGRFVKGNPGGPGRAPKEREQRYLEIAVTACSFKDWRAIIKRAVEDAKKGDHQARKWLSDVLIGPPTQRHELGGPDGGPIAMEISEIVVEMPPDELMAD